MAGRLPIHAPAPTDPGDPAPADPPPRVTMSQVARRAGCSQSTVSVVLNQRPGVTISPETRQRVIEAARALGYSYATPDAAPPDRGRPDVRRAAPAPAAKRRADPAAGGIPGRDFTAARAPRSQAGKVLRELGMAIVSGRYPQHAILPGDAELMARLGVSRTVLREAMKTLSGKGLLAAKARVGTRVRDRSEWNLFDADVLVWHARAGFDATFIRHLNEMRLTLEPEAAALAARRRTESDVEALRRCADRMGAAEVSLAAFVDADLDFHLTVASAAANPFLRSISTLIEVALVAALTRSWPGDEPGEVARSAADHRAIADAIGRGDADAARAAMRVVIGEGTARAMGQPPRR